jgi:hypothetical protein
VEQFQQVQVLLLVERDERGGLWGAEGGVAAIDDLLQVGGGDLRGRDVEREDGVGEVGEGEVAPGGLPVGG